MTDFEEARRNCEETAEELDAILLALNAGGRNTRRAMAGEMVKLLGQMKGVLSAAAELLEAAEQQAEALARMEAQMTLPEDLDDEPPTTTIN